MHRVKQTKLTKDTENMAASTSIPQNKMNIYVPKMTTLMSQARGRGNSEA